MSAEPDDTTAEDEIPAGVGAQLAAWSLDAIAGRPASPEGLDDDPARRLRRVNDAIAALQAALVRTDDES